MRSAQLSDRRGFNNVQQLLTPVLDLPWAPFEGLSKIRISWTMPQRGFLSLRCLSISLRSLSRIDFMYRQEIGKSQLESS